MDREGEAPRGSQAARARAGGPHPRQVRRLGGSELHWLDGFPISCPCPKEWEEACWGSGQGLNSSCEGEGNSSLDVTDRMRAHPGGVCVAQGGTPG